MAAGGKAWAEKRKKRGRGYGRAKAGTKAGIMARMTRSATAGIKSFYFQPAQGALAFQRTVFGIEDAGVVLLPFKMPACCF
jgi:hypothetical protein